jgi:hypothetical protein
MSQLKLSIDSAGQAIKAACPQAQVYPNTAQCVGILSTLNKPDLSPGQRILIAKPLDINQRIITTVGVRRVPIRSGVVLPSVAVQEITVAVLLA